MEFTCVFISFLSDHEGNGPHLFTKSILRTTVLGYVQTAAASGLSTFRCLVDASKLEGRPELDWLAHDRDSISGPILVRSKGEVDRFLVIYPCRGGALMNVAGLHPDSPDQEKLTSSE